jgi:hypothetical protein
MVNAMTNRIPAKKLYLPLVILFICINAFLIAGKKWLANHGIDQTVVIYGNLLLGMVTFLSLYFYQRAMTHPSTAGFLRNTYSGIMIKLFVCMVVVLLYALTAGKNINKGGLFASIFLYLVYTILEMRSLLRWNKERKNA